MKKPVLFSLLSFCLSLSSSAFAASYDQPGPNKVKTQDFTAGSLKGKIAFPEGLTGPAPLLVLGHGFSAAPDNQIGWGQHFASYGFIAVAPDLLVQDLAELQDLMQPLPQRKSFILKRRNSTK